MSIQGTGGTQGIPGLMPREPLKENVGNNQDPGQVRTPTPRTSPSEVSRDVQTPDRPAPGMDSAGELPEEAPLGTDPALWSVLTTEERAYFARARARGPVTYGQSKLGLAEVGLHRGGRLDVRV